MNRFRFSGDGLADRLPVPREPAGQASISTARSERDRSLDAFRGITIAAMILVNNPGTSDSVYGPLHHAEWNGWTPTDLVFPFFLFITGVAVTLSLDQRRRGGAPRKVLLARIARRMLLIFLLGIILNGFPLFDWSTLRIPGVLQRIALCYAAASVIVLTTGVRAQAGIAALLVTGYWAAMTLVAVPGSDPSEPERNLAALIDGALLHGHLLHGSWDPEGLLSTLPALGTTLAGVLAGRWIRSVSNPPRRVAGLFAAGMAAVALGLMMDRWCPINKQLWSGSFVVFTAGAALTVLALCSWLIDVQHWRRWATPFVIYGMNPIVAYVLSGLMAKELFLWRVVQPDGSTVECERYLFETVFLPLARPVNASLLYAVTYVLLWLGITAFLYRRRVIIKI